MNESQSIVTLESTVPFGKYRGRTFAEMLADTSYMNWLSMQPWFRDRFPSAYDLVLAGATGADNPTPEHNAIQARFADRQYVRCVLQLLGHEFLDPPVGMTWDDAWKEAGDAAEKAYRARSQEVQARELRDACRRQRDLVDATKASFEIDDWDVCLGDLRRIELKPTVGDEYPAVARKVRRRYLLSRQSAGAVVVAFDRWVSEMPLATVQAMFSDITWLQLPPPEAVSPATPPTG